MAPGTMQRVWLRLDLPRAAAASLEQSVADLGVELRQGKDTDLEPEWIERVDAVYTEEPLPETLVQRMPDLRWLHVTRGGVYAYLTPSVIERPIQVSGSRGIHGPAFSEFAIALIFALAKRLSECWQAQEQKAWAKLMPGEVAGKTLGIVGLGVVGSATARKAKALGMRVIATRRTVSEKPDEVDELGPPAFLPDLLRQSDFVLLTLASIPDTEGILGERELRLMKPSAFLINLTTGKAVAEADLVQALKEGWIAGAALDALPRQPLPVDSELWSLPNVMITPRLGGLSARKWETLLPIFSTNLQRFLRNEELLNIVDKARGY